MHKIEKEKENNEAGGTKDDCIFQAEGVLENQIKN